ncbi:uncharacterized protein K460DRAFT_271163 [Cucurbitaria berberidis CBS 394.84]|uniref:SprT-like domain-containing protein n=1 Tax=Cucurbitaria berberidis CBS 394.84 TaxID=1168544 RepID=A0A9P4GRJ4_9PLEO|nr:uncharacterized protein K460DRAFT_271163 [Cucurbitaria berberidis CBS 394.84]KAF1849791.1 hypothetical protein K460DRAFT_271163 [Cucurbitaria berberidis CBS 394.84]
MFIERWAIGRGQHTHEFFQDLKPALQLVSMLFTEQYPLLWFSHLTFGERRRSSSGVYIAPTPYSTSPEAVARVRSNLRELGKVITFMWSPPNWNISAWGLTYSNRDDEPRFCEFRDEDWPPIRSRTGYACPVIVMKDCFQVYFRNSNAANSTVNERYRALLTFAVTLGHEVAHAYEFWLGGRGGEPLWSKSDKHAELGFSWEKSVIGRVLNPTNSATDDKGRFRTLCSVQLEEYGTEAERNKLLDEFEGRTSAQFTSRDVAGRHRNWPLLDPREFRGAKWYLSPNATAIVASIHAIPSQWVCDWFQKDVLLRRKMEWAQRQAYKPPPLEDAFMIIYERNAHGAQIQRPLDPFFPVDRDILRQRAQKKTNAARVKR